jgi:hypothetical protein
MPSDRTFLLDANVFIEAKRRYYAFDLCPGFWECLIWHHNGASQIQSIDRIKRELERGGDDLKDWVASAMPSTCFASTNDTPVVDEYGRIISWVQRQAQFYPEAKGEFAASADGWLIAYAKVNKLVLVTHEVFAPEARRKVPMPNVCEAFRVAYVNTFDMLRELEASFSWESSS